MKSKQNLKIVLPLIVITVITWSIIIYSIVDGFSYNEPIGLPPNTSFDHDNLDDEFTRKIDKPLSYKKLAIDPFKMKTYTITSPKTKKSISSNRKKKQSTSINYRIIGTIIDDNKKIVTLEDLSKNQITNLQEGEKYFNIKIISIGINDLVLIEKGERKIVEINPIN
ncbi:MAG: hypothetical protein HND52_20660 [Ignavibacteriae bacterium]|nr:hypothetical protein [Ignavibacteriota bacterium]NOH00384.1 hypothetical protein [Ignavibacteriota bacterium]